MARYKSDQPVYLSDEGRYIQPGEEFASEHVPGLFWQPLDKAAKTAVAARDEARKAKAEKAAGQANDTNGIKADELADAVVKAIRQAAADFQASTAKADGGSDGESEGDPGGDAGSESKS